MAAVSTGLSLIRSRTDDENEKETGDTEQEWQLKE